MVLLYALLLLLLSELIFNLELIALAKEFTFVTILLRTDTPISVKSATKPIAVLIAASKTCGSGTGVEGKEVANVVGAVNVPMEIVDETGESETISLFSILEVGTVLEIVLAVSIDVNASSERKIEEASSNFKSDLVEVSWLAACRRLLEMMTEFSVFSVVIGLWSLVPKSSSGLGRVILVLEYFGMSRSSAWDPLSGSTWRFRCTGPVPEDCT